MLRKSFDIIKNNPILILFSIIFSVITTPIYSSMNNPDNMSIISTRHPSAVLGYIFLYSIIIIVVSILYTSGFYAMIGEAVTTGKTKTSTFLKGIKKFTIRIFLASLLYGAFIIGYSILISLISVPITISLAMSKGDNIVSLVTILFIIILLPCLFLAPLLMLWYPSMIIDDIGVIEGLNRGAKAGKKSYWTIILSLIIFMIPSLIYIFSMFKNNSQNIDTINTFNQFSSPGYWIFMIISLILGIMFKVFLYVVYEEKSKLLPPINAKHIMPNTQNMYSNIENPNNQHYNNSNVQNDQHDSKNNNPDSNDNNNN